MERLTETYYDDFGIKHSKIKDNIDRKTYRSYTWTPQEIANDKLAEFEDFMENLGLEDLEELEHIIGYPRFIDGYNEQGKEVNKIEFVTYKESFDEVFDKNKKLKQEMKVLIKKLKENKILQISLSKEKVLISLG